MIATKLYLDLQFYKPDPSYSTVEERKATRKNTKNKGNTVALINIIPMHKKKK